MDIEEFEKGRTKLLSSVFSKVIQADSLSQHDLFINRKEFASYILGRNTEGGDEKNEYYIEGLGLDPVAEQKLINIFTSSDEYIFANLDFATCSAYIQDLTNLITKINDKAIAILEGNISRENSFKENIANALKIEKDKQQDIHIRVLYAQIKELSNKTKEFDAIDFFIDIFITAISAGIGKIVSGVIAKLASKVFFKPETIIKINTYDGFGITIPIKPKFQDGKLIKEVYVKPGSFVSTSVKPKTKFGEYAPVFFEEALKDDIKLSLKQLSNEIRSHHPSLKAGDSWLLSFLQIFFETTEKTDYTSGIRTLIYGANDVLMSMESLEKRYTPEEGEEHLQYLIKYLLYTKFLYNYALFSDNSMLFAIPDLTQKATSDLLKIEATLTYSFNTNDMLVCVEHGPVPAGDGFVDDEIDHLGVFDNPFKYVFIPVEKYQDYNKGFNYGTLYELGIVGSFIPNRDQFNDAIILDLSKRITFSGFDISQNKIDFNKIYYRFYEPQASRLSQFIGGEIIRSVSFRNILTQEIPERKWKQINIKQLYNIMRPYWPGTPAFSDELTVYDYCKIVFWANVDPPHMENEKLTPMYRSDLCFVLNCIFSEYVPLVIDNFELIRRIK